MKRSSQYMAVAALLGLTGFSAMSQTASHVHRSGPYKNEAGQPLRTPDGQRILYKKNEWRKAPARNTATAPSTAAASAANALQPSWSYTAFGTDIGRKGLVATTINGKKEVFATASGGGFSANTYWYSMTSASGVLGDGMVQTFASEQLEAQIVKLALAKGAAGDQRIVVALSNGTVIQYDATTKQVKERAAGPCADKHGTTAFTTGDLNGDGIDEFISTCGNHSLIAHGPAYAAWSLASVDADELVLGQMDNDAAIEIATNQGKVIDSASRSIQWTYSDGFGEHVIAGDIDGDGRDELLGSDSWNFVNAFDVEKKLPKWTVEIDGDIDAIQLGDVNNDGVRELLIGELQGSTVHVFDLASLAEIGQLSNPEGSVTNLLVTDVNADGANEILWACGAHSTGPDYLNVASWSSRKIEWHSLDLVGPFVGPVVGDLDGDGLDEIVFGTYESDSGYESAQIIVLDGKTLAVRGISAPIVDSQSWTGLQDLQLADVDADGRKEILVAADRLYDGALEVYRFNKKNIFKRITQIIDTNARGFYSVAAADTDGDGSVELMGGASGFVYAYDPLVGSQKWRSPVYMGGAASDIIVGDFDDESALEIAAMSVGGKPYILSGTTHEVEGMIDGLDSTSTSMSAVMTPSGLHLLVGDSTGTVHEYAYRSGTYKQIKSRQATTGRIDGVTAISTGTSWVGSGGVVRSFNKKGVLKYESVNLGHQAGRTVVRMKSLGLDLTTGGIGLYGLPYAK
jgi:hypothetical protein